MYTRLSAKGRRTLMATGKCFRCRKFGHIARDCPQNLGSDDGDDSGPGVFTIAVNSIGRVDRKPAVNDAEGVSFRPDINTRWPQDSPGFATPPLHLVPSIPSSVQHQQHLEHSPPCLTTSIPSSQQHLTHAPPGLELLEYPLPSHDRQLGKSGEVILSQGG